MGYVCTILTCFVILGEIEVVWVGMARDGGIIAPIAGSQKPY